MVVLLLLRTSVCACVAGAGGGGPPGITGSKVVVLFSATRCTAEVRAEFVIDDVATAAGCAVARRSVIATTAAVDWVSTIGSFFGAGLAAAKT